MYAIMAEHADSPLRRIRDRKIIELLIGRIIRIRGDYSLAIGPGQAVHADPVSIALGGRF